MIRTLERADEGIETVVIRFSDGHYESSAKANWLEYARNDPDARIIYTVRSLDEFGNEATAEDIPGIVDQYILPSWDDLSGAP